MSPARAFGPIEALDLLRTFNPSQKPFKAFGLVNQLLRSPPPNFRFRPRCATTTESSSNIADLVLFLEKLRVNVGLSGLLLQLPLLALGLKLHAASFGFWVQSWDLPEGLQFCLYQECQECGNPGFGEVWGFRDGHIFMHRHGPHGVLCARRLTVLRAVLQVQVVVAFKKTPQMPRRSQDSSTVGCRPHANCPCPTDFTSNLIGGLPSRTAHLPTANTASKQIHLPC